MTSPLKWSLEAIKRRLKTNKDNLLDICHVFDTVEVEE
jgi:hypothetical protein